MGLSCAIYFVKIARCLPLVFLAFLIWKTSFEWSDVVCDVNGIMKAYRLQEK